VIAPLASSQARARRATRAGGVGNRRHVLVRLAGPNGEIRILEDPSTGARLYEEGGVTQSCVLAGGEAGVAYVGLMAALMVDAAEVLLLGCGGGSLAGMLYRRGCRVTVVEVNPISFQLARTFFWMPDGVECIRADVRDFQCPHGRTFDGIGIDVGGPQLLYADVLAPATIARLRCALRGGGRITVNLALKTPGDPAPGSITDRLAATGLQVWAFTQDHRASQRQRNAVILASARREKPRELAKLGGDDWALARLGSNAPHGGAPVGR
jgi:spermidine synthase